MIDAWLMHPEGAVRRSEICGCIVNDYKITLHMRVDSKVEDLEFIMPSYESEGKDIACDIFEWLNKADDSPLVLEYIRY